MNIYDIGRQTMRKNRIDRQWINVFPSIELIKEDIKNGLCYLITQNNQIHAIFALIFGNDITYSVIEDSSPRIAFEIHKDLGL